MWQEGVRVSEDFRGRGSLTSSHFDSRFPVDPLSVIFQQWRSVVLNLIDLGLMTEMLSKRDELFKQVPASKLSVSLLPMILFFVN